MDELDLTDFDTFTAPEQPQVEATPTEQPIAEEAEPLLSDFDAFTTPQQPDAPQAQVDPQVAQIEQHRPPNIDDASWLDIAERVGKFLVASVTALPRAGYEAAKEQVEYTQSEIGKAQSVKA